MDTDSLLPVHIEIGMSPQRRLATALPTFGLLLGWWNDVAVYVHSLGKDDPVQAC